MPPDPPPQPPETGRRDAWRLIAVSVGCLGAAAVAAILAYGFWSLLF